MTTKSVIMMPKPRDIPVYLLRTMPMMSEPPVEARPRKTMPSPTPSMTPP